MLYRTPKQADKLLDQMVAHSQINPFGFRSPPTGKHANGRDRKPTVMEALAVQAKISTKPPKREEGYRQTDLDRVTTGGHLGILIGRRGTKSGRARIFRP